MSFRLIIGGIDFGQTEFNVQESATPLAAGDSSGQAGSMSFTVPKPDPDVNPDHPTLLYGFSWLVGRDVRLEDSRKGFTVGRVISANSNLSAGTFQVQAESRLGQLNVYNTQAQPYHGPLSGAFQSYLALAGITSDFLVDPAIADRVVTFPGWGGELWFHLKQLAAAEDCDVTLVSGIVILRPIRGNTVNRGRDIDRSITVGGGTLAQKIVVNQYNNLPITNELVYPPGGWNPEVSTINVNSGESVEEIIQLSASVSSIQQPVMQTFVSRTYSASSVFTVVGDDGLPIQPAQWADQGGRLRVEINEDTTSLTVFITAPTGIRNKDNKEIGVYGISLSSDSSTGRYSTLRIVGSGVAFNKEEVEIPTGVLESETGTEIGATIDNPFLTTRDQVYTAGVRAVRNYNGSGMSISGSVVSVNQRGDTAEILRRPYSYDQFLHDGQTYAQVQLSYAGMTYSQVQDSINPGGADTFDNQVFGNVSGARVWDEGSQRWYRIRTATMVPSTIQFEAEDDLTHLDVQDGFEGDTYADFQMRYNGFSYKEVDLMGLRR